MVAETGGRDAFPILPALPYYCHSVAYSIFRHYFHFDRGSRILPRYVLLFLL